MIWVYFVTKMYLLPAWILLIALIFLMGLILLLGCILLLGMHFCYESASSYGLRAHFFSFTKVHFVTEILYITTAEVLTEEGEYLL